MKTTQVRCDVCHAVVTPLGATTSVGETVVMAVTGLTAQADPTLAVSCTLFVHAAAGGQLDLCQPCLLRVVEAFGRAVRERQGA